MSTTSEIASGQILGNLDRSVVFGFKKQSEVAKK